VSACTPYDPPVQGDRALDTYKADLEKSSTEAVRLNAATLRSWVISRYHRASGGSCRDPEVHGGEGGIRRRRLVDDVGLQADRVAA